MMRNKMSIKGKYCKMNHHKAGETNITKDVICAMLKYKYKG